MLEDWAKARSDKSQSWEVCHAPSPWCLFPGVSDKITQVPTLVTVFMIRSYVAYQLSGLAPERILWDREAITCVIDSILVP